ncbi:beige beach domain-containing protein [Zalerion maritima]|uniref:Beige protein homolog 1 n=1 Tax=Zalerion maritima TaxID=339359 RepID=A0AAD5RQ67_9PEZI|nr:beige beach domain-containing protein [Zalerion maritima]
MSSRPPRRYRSSTSASTPPPTTKSTEVLQSLVDGISFTLESRLPNGYPDIKVLATKCRQVSQHIAAMEPPSFQQDDFRHVRGFHKLLDVLRMFSGFYNPQVRTEDEKQAFFELLDSVLASLSAGLREHLGNNRLFRNKVDGGGWETLEQILASIGLGGSDSDLWTSCQLFGKLLSFALHNSRFDKLCQSVAETERPSAPALAPPEVGEIAKQGEKGCDVDTVTKIVRGKLQKILDRKTHFEHVQIIRTVIGFWEALPRGSAIPVNLASVVVLQTLHQVCSRSLVNLEAAHRTGVLSRFIRVGFSDPGAVGDAERAMILDMCALFMPLGVNELADTQFLLSRQDPRADKFCLEMTEKYHGPALIQFDLSIHGYSAVEIPTLRRQFPPQSAPGYTFTSWFYIDQFDPNSHTTIFGIFDQTQTCFLLGYLERDTHNFILQTSVTSAKPSVRFKSFVFKEQTWYHIALVHKRPKAITSAKAFLYVNGEFVEQQKPNYPSLPPPANGSTESFASFSSLSVPPKHNPVQAFLGTPKGLSTQIGRGLVNSKWSLASAHLFEDVLSDDLIAVYNQLGPRYQGNYQDCLGGFQTYSASASLGLRNEVFNSGRQDNSEILRVIRDRAATLMPESKILLSMMPSAVFSQDNLSHDSQLFRCLSRAAVFKFYHTTQSKGSQIALNTAFPFVNDAFCSPEYLGNMAGNPLVIVPKHIDDSIWELGGFTAVAVKLLERTSSSEELLRSLKMAFLWIRHSWRNSEAVEHDQGYAIMGMILRAKLGFSQPSSEHPISRLLLTVEERDALSCQVLSTILDFIGYNHENPVDSFIINPLAYRILLVDFDTWRKSARQTQELYYKQFTTFAVKSKYHDFNARRLLRMRIVKRLLDALKGEPITEEMLPNFMAPFESLISCQFSSEVHRALALFITYAFHSATALQSRTPRPSTSVSRSSTPGPKRPILDTGSNASGSPSKVLSKRQLGKVVLDLYSRMLLDNGNKAHIEKFARTVTNKVTTTRPSANKPSMLIASQWLLYLLSDSDPDVVVQGCKILSRLLVTHGHSYVKKFRGQGGGFHVMAHRLKRWWGVKALWPICFCLMLGLDVANVDLTPESDTSSWVTVFSNHKIVYPEALPIITGMLRHGLKEILRYQDDPDSPSCDSTTALPQPVLTRPRARSGGSILELEPRGRPQQRGGLSKAYLSAEATKSEKARVLESAGNLQMVIRFLEELHAKSAEFREFGLMSEYMRYLFGALFPAVVSTDPVSPETELNSRDSVLSFEGGDVIIRPLSGAPAPIIRTSSIVDGQINAPSRPHHGTPLRKASSFIILSSQKSPPMPSQAKFDHVMSPKKKVAIQKISNAVLEGILGLAIGIFLDQILARKEFPGFGLVLKVPPGFQEHQAYFESYVLRSAISKLESKIQENQAILHEPRVLTNMARLHSYLAEAIFEGWFINGASTMTDFTGMTLEYLQRPDIASLKSVRLCSQAVSSIRHNFLKIVLLQVSEMDDAQISDQEAKAFMDKLFYWQTVLLECLSAEDESMKLFWYQLYIRLVDKRDDIRRTAANIWRIMLVQKPEESSTLFKHIMASEQNQITKGFKKLVEIDNEAFVEWVDHHRPNLDGLFFGGMSKSWEEFVSIENSRTAETAKGRIAKRKEKLRLWHIETQDREGALLKHDMGNTAWMRSVYNSERGRFQRLVQDQQDDLVFLAARFSRMDKDLRRPGAAFSEHMVFTWKLDRTEGRNRMRLRLLPESTGRFSDYQPKRRISDMPPTLSMKLNTAVQRASPAIMSGSPVSMTAPGEEQLDGNISNLTLVDPAEGGEPVNAPEDDFELVDDPNDADESAFEDKNRKVMRQLQQGDAVQHVWNICRIIGLEANEGIIIVGKLALYMVDNVFHRSDGEIVNAWEAPKEERDPFVDLAGGSKATRTATSFRGDQDCRCWKYPDILSISKRRYLFRDVAVEIFFTDGRSYLLTLMNPSARDDLYSKIAGRASHTVGTNSLPNPEDSWRLEALRVVEEAPQNSFGAKFGNIFNQAQWNPAMRRWQRGEISNFHYLMLVNTMAGRTFNDLTQYPVFPWVLADYSSEHLDLEDPKSFRDLAKPMGAQTPERRENFDMKYKALAEVGETPFHYGTHYSSAMIVASYLIRLPPFVQSFILLQGGTFDHPDRLFYSIPRAWSSASRENASDVRELIPEFFYLPEFLENINGYNFGERQGNGGKVDGVLLPPWAHGDPKIFIAKHREALESPYVTRNLHRWIDIIFGYKQKGDAAVDNLNVFHHLSYHGAKDLDNIDDPQERAITTSIIHNFGQTPHQIFTKPHPQRDMSYLAMPRLDTSAEHLKKLPNAILGTLPIGWPLGKSNTTNVMAESSERVSHLVYVEKKDQLLCSTAFRINLPPFYDKFLEWGYADNSVRFFFAGDRKPAGIFENLHNGQLSCVVFADSRTLVTAGEDCVVGVYTLKTAPGKIVDLAPRQSLFGHKTPVNQIAVSKHFSTMVSVSVDGQAFLWDLNRLEFIRKLNFNRPVESAQMNEVSGEIMLAAGPNLVMFTLNGELILDQNVCLDGDDFIHCCAFYEGLGNEWLENFLVFTGHRRGRVNVWRKVVRAGRWALELVKKLDHVNPKSEHGTNHEAAITAITPRSNGVYTGDDEGRVFQWNLAVMK